MSTNPESTDQSKDTFFLHRLQEYFKIDDSSDVYGTITEIKKNIEIKEANAWLLICSIMVASLGLDLNSPAVIIGAMLISPLMSPILGVGLSVAINDRKTLNLAMTNFGLSIIISLITSCLYFLITPIGDMTPEIISRTKPTTLDVLVAFFGGIAGIISTSRKDVSNAIPGVAIATALMPPLCVSGFGIAKGYPTIALNSFYLFFLNAVFVALATYIIVKLLKFPMKEHASPEQRKRALRIISLIVFLVAIPSAMILRNLYQENQEKVAIDSFAQEFFYNNPKALEWKVINAEENKEIFVQLVGKQLNTSELDSIKREMVKYNLDDYELNLRYIQDISLDQLNQLEAEVEDFKEIAGELSVMKQINVIQGSTIDSLKTEVANNTLDNQPNQKAIQLIKIAFENIEDIQLIDLLKEVKKDSFIEERAFRVDWKSGVSRSTKKKDLERLSRYLEIQPEFEECTIIE